MDQTVTYDCFYQRLFGNCNMTYMFDANAELAPEVGGGCCGCCLPAGSVLWRPSCSIGCRASTLHCAACATSARAITCSLGLDNHVLCLGLLDAGLLPDELFAVQLLLPSL